MTSLQKVSDIFTGALLESLTRFELGVRSLVASGIRGERRSVRRGGSIEFADHRQYAHGDDLRRLDWHALARLDQLLIRLYSAEESMPLEVILDASASMDFGVPTKYVTAARIGCVLSQIALLHATPVLWRVAGGKTGEPVRMSGRNDLWRILRVLDDTVPRGTSALAAALRQGAMQGPRRRSLMLLTDGYEQEAIQPALRACRAGGTEVYLVLVLSPEEIDPAMRGEFTLIDAESATESGLVVDAGALKRYRRGLNEMREQWQEFCRATGTTLLEFSSDQTLGPGLFRALAESGLIE